MNKFLFVIFFLIISCKTQKVNQEHLSRDNDNRTRYYLMQSIESIEKTRLLEQNMIKKIENLEGTFWVKEIPETNIYSFDRCFAFFANKILIIEVNTEVRTPELPITSVQRYRFYIYKIMQCEEYEIVDDKQIKTLDGLISIFLDDTFLYIHIMGYDIEKYQLHSTFDTVDWKTVDIKPGDL